MDRRTRALALAVAALTAGGALTGCNSLDGVKSSSASSHKTSGKKGGKIDSVCDYAPRSKPPKVNLTSHQRRNAEAILVAAVDERRPKRSVFIAFTVVLPESNLNNRTVGDDGTAFGIYQQRPHLEEWAPYSSAIDPYRASVRFFERLDHYGWKNKTDGRAAADVQRPAVQYRYKYGMAANRDRARRIMNWVAWNACY